MPQPVIRCAARRAAARKLRWRILHRRSNNSISGMAEHVRALVIGGGVVGCSCLYHLTRLGWTQVLLLERDDLTSGSTWHAAGNCPTFATSVGVMKLQQYSAALYRRLGAEVGYPINYHLTGSVRLAHTAQRMDEYRYVRGLAQANGIDYEILTPEGLKERYPLLELEDLEGALWDPLDGDIDPAQLTQAFATGARQAGARIQRFTRVTGLAQESTGEWRVSTERGEYRADVVVNAAGYRAGEVMALLGQYLPIITLSHQYLVTEDIPQLRSRSERLPLLRDPDVSYYLRQERAGLILGPYEHKAAPQWLAGIPEDFSYRLWPDELERLESYIEAACARVPALASAGIKRVVNGPIPYSPDGLPYLGPAHGLTNFFHCNTFSFGITQAGGAGKACAEWVVAGGPEWDLWALDPRRFTGYATKSYALARAVEVYENEYAPAFPFEERRAGRPLRCSSLHARLAAAGAQFGVRGGWERALWFAGTPGPVAATLSFRRKHEWSQAVALEVAAVRNRVGILDLPGFTKFLVEGPQAQAYLDELVCSRLPSEGRIALAYALDARAGILSEFTVTHLDAQRFYLVSAASAEHHDQDLLRRALPSAGGVHLTSLTAAFGTLVLAGPRAREVLAQVTASDLSNQGFPWLAARSIRIGAAEVWALRINYTGELGWELHAPLADLADIYERLVRAGADARISHFGLYALDSLRIDKCYRAWKLDLESGFSPLEASLGRFVDLTKARFVGRAALLAQSRAGPSWQFVPLILEQAGTADAPYCSSVYRDTERIGMVTSGVFSHTLGKSVALAYLRTAYAHAGTRVQIDILGERCPASIAREPLFDPENRRPRA
jgi:dimethylglycine dehydrogenase